MARASARMKELRCSAPAAFLWLLAACAPTRTPEPVPPDRVLPDRVPPDRVLPDRVPPGRAAPAPRAPADPSYDWHGLIVVPFGTVLKSSGVALREVLLFDDAQAGTRNVNQDCFTVDAPPRFVGRQSESYLLCFEHDRLSRIDAVVRLGVDDAQLVFDRACAQWLKVSTPAAGTPERCAGEEGGVAFSAHLATREESVLLSMTLNAATDGSGPVSSGP